MIREEDACSISSGQTSKGCLCRWQSVNEIPRGVTLLYRYIYMCACVCIGEHINMYLLCVSLLGCTYKYNFWGVGQVSALPPSNNALFLIHLPSLRYCTTREEKWSYSSQDTVAAFALCLQAGYVNIGVICLQSPLLILPQSSKRAALLGEIFCAHLKCVIPMINKIYFFVPMKI